MLNDVKQEFWGDLQRDLFTSNTAIFLANQSLEDIIKTDGRKVHKPIVSHPHMGTYTPYSDIDFQRKRAEKQDLEVDTFEYAAEEVDITDKNQNPYDLLGQSLESIRKGLNNTVEQEFLGQLTNSFHTIGKTAVTSANILDILEEAEGKLGAFDAPYETSMRAAVLGPKTVATLRRSKSDRETRLGDQVLGNGVVGPWQGWTIVQNNNLPWSAELGLATQPTNGDTVTIAGVTFTFVDSIGTTPGNVLIGGNVGETRANLKKAIEGGADAGTDYVDLSPRNDFIIRRKRRISTTDAADMAMTGFGDISTSSDLTDGTDGFKNQVQDAAFMIRGSIDLVMQFVELEIAMKEKGFAELPKGIVGLGTKMFQDGEIMSVNLKVDASNF